MQREEGIDCVVELYVTEPEEVRFDDVEASPLLLLVVVAAFIFIVDVPDRATTFLCVVVV